MDKSQKFVFGIDLGTTYSCISYVDIHGMPVVVNNEEGDKTTPSVVEFEPENVVVGVTAKDSAITDPDNTISFVKGYMGKTDAIPAPGHPEKSFLYKGEKVSPEEVSSYILRKVTKDAASQLGVEVKDVVITCPAYFGTAECLATKNAGVIAGLNVLAIIREPAAAAISYLRGTDPQDKTVLVYDLGGGTFDVTIMKMSREGRAEIVCYDGDMALGGQHWDQKLVNYLKQEFCDSKNMSEDELEEDDLQELQLAAEKYKKILTSKPAASVTLNLAGEKGKVELTREIFNDLTRSLLNLTLEITDRAMKTAQDQHGVTVDEILLVGGSTRMPQVRSALEKYSIPIQIFEPDEAVAKGAAIYALGEYEFRVDEWKEKQESGDVDMSLEENRENAEKYQQEAAVKFVSIPGMRQKVHDVVTMATTKSYGLTVIVNDTDEKIQNMIVKNTKMENGIIQVTQQFGTHEDNQDSANLEIFESDITETYYEYNESDEFGANATALGNAILELPGNLPAHAPLEVTFSLNQEGILEVTGREISSGQEISVSLQATAGSILSTDEVVAIREKSKHITVL